MGAEGLSFYLGGQGEIFPLWVWAKPMVFSMQRMERQSRISLAEPYEF